MLEPYTFLCPEEGLQLATGVASLRQYRCSAFKLQSAATATVVRGIVFGVFDLP